MIVVNDDPPQDDDSTATMNSRYGQKFAGVWISDAFLDPECPWLNNTLRTQTLIHEVLHLHFEEPWHLVESMTENELGNQAYKAIKHVFQHQMEVAVDQLAWALVDFLPAFKLPVPEHENTE